MGNHKDLCGRSVSPVPLTLPVRFQDRVTALRRQSDYPLGSPLREW